MTAEEYKAMRKQIGTQETVAVLLGVARVTIVRREIGLIPINQEAAHALMFVYTTTTKRK